MFNFAPFFRIAEQFDYSNPARATGMPNVFSVRRAGRAPLP
jgi:hypothetical protein